MTRHPATEAILQHFTWQHLPLHLAGVSKQFADTAYLMVDGHELAGPEVTAGLRKLLEAKDCFVRAAVEKRNAAEAALKAVELRVIASAERTGEHHTGSLSLGGSGGLAA